MPARPRSSIRRARSAVRRMRSPSPATAEAVSTPSSFTSLGRLGPSFPGTVGGHLLEPCKDRSELGNQLAFRELEEPVLVGADLVDADVRVARFLVLLQVLEVFICVGAEWERSFEVVRLAVLDQLLEVARQRQLLRCGAFDEDVRPVVER